VALRKHRDDESADDEAADDVADADDDEADDDATNNALLVRTPASPDSQRQSNIPQAS